MTATEGYRLAFIGQLGSRFIHDSGSVPDGRSCSTAFAALEALKTAGCGMVYLDGSFVTMKREPGDYDACWDIAGVNVEKLDPAFLDFSRGRAAQKRKYLGEFFPAQMPEGESGRVFLDSRAIERPEGRRGLWA